MSYLISIHYAIFFTSLSIVFTAILLLQCDNPNIWDILGLTAFSFESASHIFLLFLFAFTCTSRIWTPSWESHAKLWDLRFCYIPLKNVEAFALAVVNLIRLKW